MKRCAKNSEGVKEVLAKTLLEAAGTLFLIYMLIHEQDLIDFEIRVGEKMRSVRRDLRAIRRACRRHGIGAGKLCKMLLKLLFKRSNTYVRTQTEE